MAPNQIGERARCLPGAQHRGHRARHARGSRGRCVLALVRGQGRGYRADHAAVPRRARRRAGDAVLWCVRLCSCEHAARTAGGQGLKGRGLGSCEFARGSAVLARPRRPGGRQGQCGACANAMAPGVHGGATATPCSCRRVSLGGAGTCCSTVGRRCKQWQERHRRELVVVQGQG